MSSNEVQQARDSLSRCLSDTGFLDHFYELFMSSSSEVAEKFKKTEFVRQKRMLSDSLYALLLDAGSSDAGIAHGWLKKIAKRHNRNNLDIQSKLYSLWLECLIKAITAHDPEFSEQIEKAWRASLKPGIEFMQANY